MKYILERFVPDFSVTTISNLHGQPVPTKMDYGPAFVLPLYHPAVAVYNAKTKEGLIADMMVINQILKNKNG